MSRKGASMALTLVIVGVVLIMTAITVITFTTGGLGQFFGFGQQNLDVSRCQQQISQWCQQTERSIGSELADSGRYTQSATVSECTTSEDDDPETEEIEKTTVNSDCSCDGSGTESDPHTNCERTYTDGEVTCTSDIPNNDPNTLSSQLTRNDCRADWTHNQAPDFVTGDYNCKENFRSVDIDGRCPAQ